MMKVQLHLYSVLRDKLPKEARGHVQLDLEEGVSLSDLLEQLEIPRRVVISVNGKHETDLNRCMADGDDIHVFSSVSGG